MTDAVQWVCAKCGTVMGDEASEAAVVALRADLAKAQETIALLKAEACKLLAGANNALTEMVGDAPDTKE